MTPKALLLFLCAALLVPLAGAKVIGTNCAPAPLTAARIATLPEASQGPWKAYLEASLQGKAADQAALKAELQAGKLTEIIPAPKGHDAGLPLDKPAAWYAEPEGLRIADCIVSYQTPTGGWGKNITMTAGPRKPGQHFASENKTRFPSPGDNDLEPADGWSYVGTFDNDATISQLRFLAKTISVLGFDRSVLYQQSFLRGLNYLAAAQYPNGGFPQVYPLMGGYHDAITMNDGAMISIIELLQDIADGADSFGWVIKDLRTRAREGRDKAVACLLGCQIIDQGRLTVWCQQHDLLTLLPASARNYEMPSECAGESAEITRFLMSIKAPERSVMVAVHCSAAWFAKTALHDVSFKLQEGERRLRPAPGSAPLWARYYEIGSHRPIFGDRDKSIHDDVNEISLERRNGYAWFGTWGSSILEQYPKWKARL